MRGAVKREWHRDSCPFRGTDTVSSATSRGPSCRKGAEVIPRSNALVPFDAIRVSAILIVPLRLSREGSPRGATLRIPEQKSPQGGRHPRPRGRASPVRRPKRAGIAAKIGRPVVLKIQVWLTGRAGLGGIQFAATPGGGRGRKPAGMLGMKVGNYVVDRILVEEKLDDQGEYFAGLVIDDARQMPGPRLQRRSAGRGSRRSPGAIRKRSCRLPIDVGAGLERVRSPEPRPRSRARRDGV